MVDATGPGAAGNSARRSLQLEGEAPLQNMPDQAPGWFISFFKGFENRIEHIIDSVLSKRLSDLTIKLDEQEEKVIGLEMEVDGMKKAVVGLKEENTSLKLLVDDLENRSRRSNLVFHGIPEVGDAEDCRKTIDTVLQQFVGLSQTDYSIERVHRTPTTMQPRSRQGQQSDSRPAKPRMIHICFSSLSQKEKVRAECMKKFKAEDYHGPQALCSRGLQQKSPSTTEEQDGAIQEPAIAGKEAIFHLS